MPVKITNNRRRMLAFNLMHPDHLKGIVVRTTVVAPDGRRYPKTIARRVPRDLTLTAKGTPGSTSKELPDTVLNCAEVAAARNRGDIKVTQT